MNYLKYINTLTDSEAKFTITNIDKSWANALRRIIISEVETFGFDINESIVINENTSKLHNEMIKHRISLIPLNIIDPNFDSNNYKFVINKSNSNSNQIINATSGDFEIYKKNEKTKEWIINPDLKDKFFIKNELSDHYIPIVPLGQDGTLEGEKINIECFAVRRNALYNSSFSPVCKSIFTNSLDKEKCELVLEDIIKDISDNYKKESKRKLFYNTEALEYYKKDEFNDPYEFDFEIESIGILSTKMIIQTAIGILINKLEKFRSNINNNAISFKRSELVNYKAYDLKIPNENHTLGNLLQSYVYKYCILDNSDGELKYVAYDIPHPLEKITVLRLSLKNDTYPEGKDIKIIKDLVITAVDRTIDISKKINSEWDTYFKKNKE